MRASGLGAARRGGGVVYWCNRYCLYNKRGCGAPTPTKSAGCPPSGLDASWPFVTVDAASGCSRPLHVLAFSCPLAAVMVPRGVVQAPGVRESQRQDPSVSLSWPLWGVCQVLPSRAACPALPPWRLRSPARDQKTLSQQKGRSRCAGFGWPVGSFLSRTSLLAQCFVHVKLRHSNTLTAASSTHSDTFLVLSFGYAGPPPP
jgi:hypothetical protein